MAIPGVTQPIPPTDPARAATYKNPRPGMQVGTQATYTPQPPQNFAPQAPPAPWETEDGGPPVRGLAAFRKAVVAFETRGIVYGYRYLGVKDACKIYALCEEIISWGVNSGVVRFGSFISVLKQTRTITTSGSEAWLLTLVAPFLGVREFEDQILEFLESILIVVENKEDDKGTALASGALNDPELFSMACIPEALIALASHPDLVSFFGSCGAIAENPIVARAAGYLAKKAQAAQKSQTSTDGNES